MVRNTLICTVGISLLSNMEKSNDPDISKYYKTENWVELGKLLAKRDPNDRILGAELNSLAELFSKDYVRPIHIWFLISDTKEAIRTKSILTHYFLSTSWTGVDSRNVCYKTIEALQDDRPDLFRTRGLRNLIRAMADIVRQHGPEFVAIDATGGYKAQIGLAVVFGQAMNIPVYYKHERFKYLIELPPMPITLDYEVLGQNAWLLQTLENQGTFTSEEIGEVAEKVKVLLQDVEVDGQRLWEISPVGLIYLEGFRQRVSPTVNIESSQNREEPNFPNHHYPKGFKDLVLKVWRENPWINTCITLGSDGQKGMRCTRFFTRKNVDNTELVGEYVSDYGARFRIYISSNKPHELAWAAMQLNTRYSR